MPDCSRCHGTGTALVHGATYWDDNVGTELPLTDFCNCPAGSCARSDFIKAESKRWELTLSPPKE